MFRRKLARETFVEIAPPRPADSGTRSRPRVAVFAAHGMGQQVRFETIEGVAAVLRKAQAWAGRPLPDVLLVQVRAGDEFLARAEMDLESEGHEAEVHVYEAYWAPQTEGAISTLETFLFLFHAGWDGLASAARGWYRRLIFGRWQSWPVGDFTFLAFVIATLVLGALGVMNAAVLALGSGHVLFSGLWPWPPPSLVAALTRDFEQYLLVLATLLLLGIFVPSLLRRPGSAQHIKPPWGWVSWTGIALVALAVAFTIGSGARIAWDLALGPPATAGRVPGRLETLAMLAATAWLGTRARFFIRQFVGDVAIYVSSHRVNRFHAVRATIQQICSKVARTIYTLRDAKDGAPYYDRVVVVGHSLGSVIAYDTLNAMLREDIAAGGANRVQERTDTFLTFGSPLDKTAYLFRTQKAELYDIREGLSTAYQPLVLDYAFRPRKWINLHSPFDWISAKLDYYDENPPADARQIDNRIDPDASTPLLAHNEYWDGALFARLLFEAVTA